MVGGHENVYIFFSVSLSIQTIFFFRLQSSVANKLSRLFYFFKQLFCRTFHPSTPSKKMIHPLLGPKIASLSPFKGKERLNVY